MTDDDRDTSLRAAFARRTTRKKRERPEKDSTWAVSGFTSRTPEQLDRAAAFIAEHPDVAATWPAEHRSRVQAWAAHRAQQKEN